jgi:hypothetical protein
MAPENVAEPGAGRTLDDPVNPPASRRVAVRRKDGGTGTFLADRSKAWDGLPTVDWGAAVDPCSYCDYLYVTGRGAYVLERTWQSTVSFIVGPEELPPEDFFEELDEDEAERWYVERCADVGRHPLPASMRKRLADLDLDGDLESADGKASVVPDDCAPGGSENCALTGTAELLLSGLEALGPGSHTAEKIAARARLKTSISRIRETLGWLKKMEFVTSGRGGYTRTRKVYAHPLPPVP